MSDTVHTIYRVWLQSEIDSESFDYDTMREAYLAIARIATRAADLNDGMERNFSVEIVTEILV